MTHFYSKTTLLGLTLAIGLSGCGDRKIMEGQFIDSAVENISYRTDSVEGATDSGGNFSYRKSETIEFFINDISFGSGAVTELMTPINLVADSSIDTASVINRAILLQSLDANSDTSDGITIPALAHTTSGSTINFDQTSEAFSGDAAVLSYVRAAKNDTSAVLVTASVAKAHLADSIGTSSSSADPEVGASASELVVGANETVTLTGTTNSLIVNFRWEQDVNNTTTVTLTDGADSADLTQFQASFVAPVVAEITNLTFQFIGEDSDGIEYSAPVIIQINPS